MVDIAGWTSTLQPTSVRRYGVSARWFHWVTTALIAIIIPLGWIFAEFKVAPDGKHFHAYFPGTVGQYASAHKTLGLTVLAIVLARLAYRLANPPPALPRSTSTLEAGLAHLTHWVLYLLLLVMPISGYIMSSGSGHPISILGLFDFPKIPGVSKTVELDAAVVHLSAQFAVYAFVVLHVAGVAWHLFVRRDDLIARMLPRQVEVD